MGLTKLTKLCGHVHGFLSHLDGGRSSLGGITLGGPKIGRDEVHVNACLVVVWSWRSLDCLTIQDIQDILRMFLPPSQFNATLFFLGWTSGYMYYRSIIVLNSNDYIAERCQLYPPVLICFILALRPIKFHDCWLYPWYILIQNIIGTYFWCLHQHERTIFFLLKKKRTDFIMFHQSNPIPQEGNVDCYPKNHPEVNLLVGFPGRWIRLHSGPVFGTRWIRWTSWWRRDGWSWISHPEVRKKTRLASRAINGVLMIHTYHYEWTIEVFLD